MEWASIDEAARRLDVGVEALRKRAQRGADNTRKNKGRWEFLIPEEVEEHDVVEEPEPDNLPDTQDTSAEEVYRYALRMQRDEIEHLREQLERKDRIIEGLMSRVPELSAAEPAKPERRALWRRIFRG